MAGTDIKATFYARFFVREYKTKRRKVICYKVKASNFQDAERIGRYLAIRDGHTIVKMLEVHI